MGGQFTVSGRNVELRGTWNWEEFRTGGIVGLRRTWNWWECEVGGKINCEERGTGRNVKMGENGSRVVDSQIRDVKLQADNIYVQ